MSSLQHVTHGFGPVWDNQSEVLILGSMPSTQSRQAGFYYMFPRNRFWPVMAALFKSPLPEPDPEVRRHFALDHRIALWDVVQECDIRGASDASITRVIPTDIGSILTRAPIRSIFTTGRKAGELYVKYSEPLLQKMGIDLPMINLPSTSPANAAKSLKDLISDYAPIKDALNMSEENSQVKKG